MLNNNSTSLANSNNCMGTSAVNLTSNVFEYLSLYRICGDKSSDMQFGVKSII